MINNAKAKEIMEGLRKKIGHVQMGQRGHSAYTQTHNISEGIFIDQKNRPLDTIDVSKGFIMPVLGGNVCMKNNLVFYGTSAAEGIPSPFCSCSVCENARREKGKEIRRRSMFRINEEVCIDLGADALQQAIEFGDFTGLQHVLVTHTHEDHFDYMMMNVRKMAIERTQEPLHYYFTDKGYDIVGVLPSKFRNHKGHDFSTGGKRDCCLSQAGVWKALRYCRNGSYTCGGTTLAAWEENSANYLVRLPDGRKLYHGLDTGWYLE